MDPSLDPLFGQRLDAQAAGLQALSPAALHALLATNQRPQAFPQQQQQQPFPDPLGVQPAPASINLFSQLLGNTQLAQLQGVGELAVVQSERPTSSRGTRRSGGQGGGGGAPQSYASRHQQVGRGVPGPCSGGRGTRHGAGGGPARGCRTRGRCWLTRARRYGVHPCAAGGGAPEVAHQREVRQQRCVQGPGAECRQAHRSLPCPGLAALSQSDQLRVAAPAAAPAAGPAAPPLPAPARPVALRLCRLEALRKVVPHSERANTATFLEDVLKYVQRLERRVAELEREAGLEPTVKVRA